jgi:hypothetical protein
VMLSSLKAGAVGSRRQKKSNKAPDLVDVNHVETIINQHFAQEGGRHRP